MTGQEGREASAEVFDLGYQHYRGPREGRSRARRALYVNGLRTTLGIGRGPLAKVLAVLMFGAAMVPAVIMAVVVALFEPVAEALPSHKDYYELVSLVLLLFAAIVGPELLCPDRRDGVIHLYLVRPITARDYAGARWLAVLTVTFALVYSVSWSCGLGWCCPPPILLTISARTGWTFLASSVAGLVVAVSPSENHGAAHRTMAS